MQRVGGVIGMSLVALLLMVLPVAWSAQAVNPSAADNIVDIDLKFPGSAQIPGIDNGYVDPDNFPGRSVNVCGAGTQGSIQIPGAQLFVRFTVGPAVGTSAGRDLRIRFQGFAGQDRMEFVRVTQNSGGRTVIPPSPQNPADITVEDVRTGDVIEIEFLNKRGHNVITASITGFAGGGGNNVEINTVGVCPGGGGPAPAPPCPTGSLTKEIASLTLGANYTTYYRPFDLSGPGKGVFDDLTNFPAGSRLTVQFPGRNSLVYVRTGERVVNAIFVNGLSATAHPRLVLKDRYQASYQQVVAIVSEDGTAAVNLGPTLPPLASITGFSYFDRNGEVVIYNVPTDGLGGYQAVYLVTQITATRGYITNNAAIAGKLVNGRLVTISGVCGDTAETSIFNGPSTILNNRPVDDVPNHPF